MNQIEDSTTSVEILKEAISKFVADRQWEKYHNPKNLAMSIGVEAGELMEVFQWLSPRNTRPASLGSKRKQQAAEELADVLIYCLTLAIVLEIDVSSTIIRKIESNALKYPVEEYKGDYRRPQRK